MAQHAEVQAARSEAREQTHPYCHQCILNRMSEQGSPNKRRPFQHHWAKQEPNPGGRSLGVSLWPHPTPLCPTNSQSLRSAGRISLLVQWLRICLSMQGTQVQSLVHEDSTCRGASKPQELQLLKPALPRACASQLEKPLQ